MDKAKNQINDMEHKETKNNQSEQQEEESIKKKKKKPTEDSIRSLWDNYKSINIHIIDARRRRERARNWKSIRKNNEIKLPSFGEGNRRPGPGSTENPKQDGCKEAHTKTHHN